MHIGELCAGYGGLAMALQLLDPAARLAWVAEVDQDASTVLKHHHPDAPNHGDITAVDWSGAESVDVLAGGFPCFAAGTMVLTRRGYIPIEDVNVGDYALTHLGRWRQVTATMTKDGAELWSIKSGQTITTTAEHPFYVREQSSRSRNRIVERVFSDPLWVDASRLKPGVHRVGHILPPSVDSEYSDAWWWIVGRHLADGHRLKRHKTGAGNPVASDQGHVVISCGKGKEDELRKALARAGMHATESPSRTALKFVIMSQELYRFTASFGRGASNKGLTIEALSLPQHSAEALLSGWLSGDGYKTPNGGHSGVTTSKRLALGLVMLAHRARGVHASIRLTIPPKTKVIEGRTVNQLPWWRVDIPRKNRSALIEGDMAWRRVKNVQPTGTAGRVYNISVDGDQSYIADGVIVHNCQPFSMSGKRAGSDDERHLWPTGVLPALLALRPAVALFENVEGLRTIQGGAVFRQILADLMTAGYTVRWCTLGACKLSLCHHRHRLFVLATRAVGELPPELGMPLAAWSSWPRDGVASGGDVWECESDPCGTTGMTLPTPTARDASRGAGRPNAEGRPLSEVVALLPTPTTVDGEAGVGAGRRRDGRDGVPNLRTAVTLLPTPLAGRDDRAVPAVGTAEARMTSGRRMLDDAVALLPTPTATPYGNNQSPSAGASVRPSLEGVAQLLLTPRASDGAKGGPNQRGSSGDLALPAAVQPDRWGRYATAIARHEQVVGRPAPEPTVTGKRGGRRLNPELTEWMMGLPQGWITGPLAGNNNAANRAAGNGVVPMVAAQAVRVMCARAGWVGLPVGKREMEML